MDSHSCNVKRIAAILQMAVAINRTASMSPRQDVFGPAIEVESDLGKGEA